MKSTLIVCAVLAFIQIGCLGGCSTLPSGWDTVRPEALDSVSARAATLFSADLETLTPAQTIVRTAGSIGASTAVSERAAGIALETRMQDAVKAAADAVKLSTGNLASACREALDYATGIASDAEMILGTIKAARLIQNAPP